MRRLRLPLFLGISIIALILQVTPISAEIPTYVEREKDIYYFKIHGSPFGAPPAYGRAEFIYKNLSPKNQTVSVMLKFILFNVPRESTKTDIVGVGEEFTDYEAGDIGTIVNFTLSIDGLPELTGSIIIPPP